MGTDDGLESGSTTHLLSANVHGRSAGASDPGGALAGAGHRGGGAEEGTAACTEALTGTKTAIAADPGARRPATHANGSHILSEKLWEEL